MNREVRTCPSCGALIVPQLSRCRQCGTYLHGTQLEGLLVEKLLPPALRAAPGVGLVFLLVALAFILQALIAGPRNVFSFSGYSLRLLGAMYGAGILQGEWWRFLTSPFLHGGLIHLAFNLYALTIAGPVVEEMFDRKKMWAIAVTSGVLSMVASYGWSVGVLGQTLATSVGFSGAISGLIAAAIFGGRRTGPQGKQVVQVMVRWAVYIGLFGLVVRGVDNAAHLGGFAVGAGLGFVLPLGLTQTVVANRVQSVAMLAVLVAIVGSFVTMVQHIDGMPGYLKRDVRGQSFLFIPIRPGTPWERSSQLRASQDCRDAEPKDQLEVCEKAVQINPSDPGAWILYHDALMRAGHRTRARTVERVLAHLGVR